MYTLVCVLWIKRGVKIFLDPFPSVAAQRGTRRPIIRCQAVLSLLSESEKVQREGFFFRRCIPQVLNRQCENKLFSGFLDEKTTGPLLDLFGGSTKAFFRSGEEWENLLMAYNTIFTVLI